MMAMFLMKWVSMEAMVPRVFVADAADDVGAVVDVAPVDPHH